jgi:L-aminopeptidase/D-esterase-like protein
MIPGFRFGHATDAEHHTGCTVVLCPEGTIGSADVRGPAPGTREIELTYPSRPIEIIHAVLLTGGSAFGLAAADGVMRFLEEQGIGHWTPLARVPIVPAAVVYDLFLGGGKRRPDAAMGYAACQAAVENPVERGNVGAGAGVTVGKWGGFQGMMKGGFGTAAMSIDLGRSSPGAAPGPGPEQAAAVQDPTGASILQVAAAALTNCVGDVLNADGSVLAGARSPQGGWLVEQDPLRRFPDRPPAALGTNTTLLVVATNARLTKVLAHRLAQRAQDGLAIAVRPAHTTHDGDTAFALAAGRVEAPFDVVANAAVEVVAEAIRDSVRAAASVASAPGLAG